MSDTINIWVTLDLAARKDCGRAAVESAHEPVYGPEGLPRETFFVGRA